MMPRPLMAVAAAVVTLTAVACERGEGLDPSKMPEKIRADYDLFAHKCSKCHSLARPLTANITDDEQWVLYVTRMRRQPGSGISHEDQDGILRFLRYYAAELRRTQSAKNGGAPIPQAVPVLTPPSATTPSATTPSSAPRAPGADGGGS